MIDITDVNPGDDLVVIRNIKPLPVSTPNHEGSRVFAFNDVVQFTRLDVEERAEGIYRNVVIFWSHGSEFSSPAINFIPKASFDMMVLRLFPDTCKYEEWFNIESHRISPRPLSVAGD